MQATDAPVSMVATRITREGSDEVAAKKALSRRRPQPQFSERMRGRKQVENVKSRHMRKGKLAQLREQSKREEELREQCEREEHALWKREEGQGENESGALEERQSGGGGKEPIAGGQVNQGARGLKSEEGQGKNESGILEGRSSGGSKEPIAGGQANQGASWLEKKEGERQVSAQQIIRVRLDAENSQSVVVSTLSMHNEQDYLQVGRTVSSVSSTGSLVGNKRTSTTRSLTSVRSKSTLCAGISPVAEAESTPRAGIPPVGASTKGTLIAEILTVAEANSTLSQGNSEEANSTLDAGIPPAAEEAHSAMHAGPPVAEAKSTLSAGRSRTAFEAGDVVDGNEPSVMRHTPVRKAVAPVIYFSAGCTPVQLERLSEAVAKLIDFIEIMIDFEWTTRWGGTSWWNFGAITRFCT